MKKSKNIYLAIAGCICCLIAVLVVQCFVTYTLYQNSLDFEKRYLQETVDSTISYIDFSRKIIKQERKESGNQINEDEVKKRIEEFLRIRFYETASDRSYMWINEVYNYEGGSNYGIRLIHPNLKTKEGELLSTDMQDAVGDTPYLTELEGIKSDGAILHSYYFKNYENNSVSRKITYAKLYPDYNWIICVGIPYNSILGEAIFDNIFTEWILLLGYSLPIGGIVFLLFHLRQVHKKEQQKYLTKLDILREQLEYDTLTQACSRSYGIKLLENSLNDFAFYDTKNLIAIFDIDYFKSINDTYGHDTGDFVLKEIVNVIKNNIRHEDFIIRWGGDEFIVIFSQVYDINKCLQKLNRCINEYDFMDQNGNKIDVAISIGAGFFKKTDASIHDLLRRIDKNLYKAKKTRNTFYFE